MVTGSLLMGGWLAGQRGERQRGWEYGRQRQVSARGGKQASRERLFPRLPPGREGCRAVDQCGNLPCIQFAIEAKPHEVSVQPPDHRVTAERSTVQRHCCPHWNTCRAIELRTAGRQ